jgi:hypothetical protein
MNSPEVLLLFLAFSLPAIFRLATTRHRRLRRPEDILRDLKSIPSVGDISDFESWSKERDAAYWKSIGGMRGLLQARRRAIYLRDFTCSLLSENIHCEDAEYICQRCNWITVLVVLQFICIPFSEFHFAGRWATALCCECWTRTLTLCCEYNRDLYIPLSECM